MKLLVLRDLLTKQEYDFILVIVDRLIKYIIFVLYLEKVRVKQLVNTILRILIAEHGMLEQFLTDKRSVFILIF
jgi:hypothetical protein